jgi:broad specificity phosphatase PhoE
LKRCLQTINVLQDTFNHKFSNIWVDDLFKERSFGSWEGIEKKQIKRDFNVFFLQNQKFNYKLTPPNGESYDDIMVRINEILHKIESYQHHPILICSHNHLMKIILQTIMKPNESFWNRFDFLNGKIYEANGITEKFE